MTEIGLMAAFAAGVISFLSPCVLPLVPGYMSFISGVSLDELRADDRDSAVTRKILVNTFAFVIGFSIVFILLGASASFIGQVLLANQRVLRYLAGGIVILFGLHLTGILKIKWLYQDKRYHGESVARGPVGAMFLGLAFAAGREGETAPAWLNAANEVAVEAFLDGTLSWVGISELLAEALDAWPGDRADDVDAVLDVDRRARVAARALVAARA